MDYRIPTYTFSNEEELFALVKQCGGSLFLSKKHLRQAGELVLPDERLYFIHTVASPTIQVAGANKKDNNRDRGMIFITTRRIVIYDWISSPKETHVFQLEEVTALGQIRKKGLESRLSLSVGDTVIDFRAGSAQGEINEDYVRRALVQALADVGNILPGMEPSPARTLFGAENPIQSQPTAAECGGCGTTISLIPGRVNQCEYCGRKVTE